MFFLLSFSLVLSSLASPAPVSLSSVSLQPFFSPFQTWEAHTLFLCGAWSPVPLSAVTATLCSGCYLCISARLSLDDGALLPSPSAVIAGLVCSSQPAVNTLLLSYV